MNAKNILALSVLAIVFSSCQIKIGQVEPSTEEGSIEGTWSTDCMADSNDSYIKMYSIQGTSMTYTAYYYANDRLCNPANLNVTVIESGTLSVSEDSLIANAKNYEYRLSGMFLAPGSNSIASQFNLDTVCGLSDWSKDSAKLIFGCSATGLFDVSQVGPSTIHYGVMSLEAAATPNYMQFGMRCSVAGYEDLCPSPMDRPMALNGAVYFKR